MDDNRVEEIIPGIKLESSNVELSPEMILAQENMARKRIADEMARESLIKSTLAKARYLLFELGEPDDITDEDAIELGILDQLKVMRFEADLLIKLKSKFDDDDYDFNSPDYL